MLHSVMEICNGLPEALPEEDKVVVIREIQSEDLEEASTYPIVSPIYSITTLTPLRLLLACGQ